MDNDTIVAPATTYGRSSLNIIRLSGGRALSIAAKLAGFDEERFAQILPPRYAKLLKVYFANREPLDECIMLYFKAPHSYTTEDVIEFQCHGGSFIAQNLLQECLNYGARLAHAGEFTKRAFLGGRIDLSQAQAIAKLIDAQSSKTHKMLMRHLKGEMQEFCENLQTRILTLLAHSEVLIDYAEEDLPSDLLQNLENQLNDIFQKLHSLLEQSQNKLVLFEGLRVCIIGKPNVGKSSLLNALLRENRAIVSAIAGTTRDSVEENFVVDGQVLRLIDTAGIRDSSDIVESEGIRRSLKKAEESDLIIALFDNSCPLDENDAQIIALLKKYQKTKKILVVLNKSDLENQCNVDALKEFNPIFLTLKGDLHSKDSLLSQFKARLKEVLNVGEFSESLLLVSVYQFQCVEACINALRDSVNPLQNGELELFSFHLNEAIRSLANLSKPYEYSQMLDVMFGEFCLGK